MADISVDITTQSNYADIATQHVTFDWSIDFDAKILTGSATHDMKLNKDGVEEAMYVVVGSFDFSLHKHPLSFDTGDLNIGATFVDGKAVEVRP